MTARQREILSYIVTFTGGHGYPPTLRDIMRKFGITSTNGVNCHLDALERKGLIARGEAIDADGRAPARGIVVPELQKAVTAAASAYLAGLGG